MKNRIKEAYHVGGVWAVLLAMLGFAFSCSGADMYGSPYVDFEIKVKVVDSADAPLNNIRVDISNAYDYQWTDSMGIAQFQFRGNQDFRGLFEDIDGDLNGGKYKTVDTIFRFDNTQLDKGGKKNDSWYEGRIKTEVKVVMQKE